MIRNFEEIKLQLKELSEIVNSFQSEAVQLRIVELVFGIVSEEETESDNPTGTASVTTKRKQRTTKKRSNPKSVSSGEKPKKSANKPSGQGAVATLGKLVEDGFFKKPKSIGAIVEHCDHNLARKFKANEFSGKLGRLVREGSSLSRTKNAESQYEYQRQL